jgi:hypothetical protein
MNLDTLNPGRDNMMEEKVREAIVAELRRQSEAGPAKLRVSVNGGRLAANGEIDLDALAMAVVGAVSGGP